MTTLQIEILFENLFEKWPNQSGEESAKKAFTVAIKSGEDPKLIQKACEIYLLDNLAADSDYIYKFGNFIREDHWKDYAFASDKLIKKKEEALVVINSWNANCSKHWCKVLDTDVKIPIAMKALNDKAFRENWQKALKKASILFKYEFRDGDIRKNIILSLRWFCNTSPDKHSVMKIIEGEYGQPIRDVSVKNKVGQPIDYEERNKAAEELKNLFPDLKFKKETNENRTRPFQKEVVTTQAQEIANEILKEVRAKSIEGCGTDEEPIFTQSFVD